ncbi:MAG: hypothetical protein EAY65_02820 [Alphaproteobacteria bacterium]|nr:MAG: hypothetical protein EAY65_02820 [Alphaproteobacteria bacterium]
MLTTMRKLSQGFVAKLLLCVLVASFALWGIGDIFTSNAPRMVAKVGEEDIEEQVYLAALRQLRVNLGQYFTPEMVKQLDLLNVTLENLVRDSLIEQESQALHVRVSDELLKEVLAKDKQFHNDKNVFDREIFQRRLQQIGMNEHDFLDHIRRSVQHKMIQDTITPYAIVPDALITQMSDLETQQREVLVFTLDPKQFETAPLIEEGVVRQYYEQHKDRYVAPEYRRFAYVVLNREQLSKRVNISEEELSASYIDYAQKTKVPEQRTVIQLLYPSKDLAEQAYAKARTGQSFEQIREMLPMAASESIELGTITKEQLPAASDVIFSLAKGGVSAPVQTDFGWHIFKVTDIVPSHTAPFDEVKEKLKEELVRKKVDKEWNATIEKMEDIHASGAKLVDIASVLQLDVQEQGLVDAQGRAADAQPRLDSEKYQELLHTAFMLKPDALSEVTQISNGEYIVVHLHEIMPQRQRAIEEVRGQVTKDWQEDEQKQALQRSITDLEQKLTAMMPMVAAEEVKDMLAAQAITATASYQFSRLGVESKENPLAVAEWKPDFIARLFTATHAPTVLPFYVDQSGKIVGGVYQRTVSHTQEERDNHHKTVQARLEKSYEHEVMQQYVELLRTHFPVQYYPEIMNRVKDQFQ